MKEHFLPFLKTTKSWELGLWLLVHAAIPLLFVLSLFFTGPVQINTLLMDMLPQAEHSRGAAKADTILAEKNSREAVILAAAPDFENAKKGAALLYAEFEHSPAIEIISFYFDPSVITQFMDFIHNYRFVIAGDETLNLLETDGAEEIADDALAAAYGAFTFLPLENIDKDPFLLSERRMETFLTTSLLSGGKLNLKDDVLSANLDGVWYVLLRMTLTPNAVSVSGGKNIITEIHNTTETIKQTVPELEFYFSGVPFHSYESSTNAQKEISIISTISILIILFLFLFIFKTPKPVFFSVSAITVSLGMAISASFLIFREIHIITFVFGTSLIGTCIDYSIHFFSHWKGNTTLKDGYAIRSHISKSLVMSFISTEICFFVFLFAPFPILKQFAVFSMTGLLSSFLTSYLIYPRLKLPLEEKRQFDIFNSKLFLKLRKYSPAPVLRIAIIVVIAVFASAVIVFSPQRVKIENDIRSFYSMSDSLLESEKISAMVFDRGSSFWYYIISGSSPEETLQNEELLALRLKEEIMLGNLGSFLGTSVFVPSLKTQQQTYEAMKTLLPLAEAQYNSLGFPPEYAEIYYKEFAAGEIYCLPENAPTNMGVTNMWIGNVNNNYYSCILPFHSADETVFRSIADEFDFVHFINKAEDISRDLDTITRTVLFLFLAAFFVISIIVFFAYPKRDSIKICMVPIFLVLCVLAALTLNKIPLGFFPAAGFILVFGLGLDYIFYMIGKGTNQKSESGKFTILATTMSFLTTILSFGALGLSSFMPVYMFGFTVSAGLGAAFISAMILKGKNS